MFQGGRHPEQERGLGAVSESDNSRSRWSLLRAISKIHNSPFPAQTDGFLKLTQRPAAQELWQIPANAPNPLSCSGCLCTGSILHSEGIRLWRFSFVERQGRNCFLKVYIWLKMIMKSTFLIIRYGISKIFFFSEKYGRIRWMKENGYMKHRNKIFDLRKRL